MSQPNSLHPPSLNNSPLPLNIDINNCDQNTNNENVNNNYLSVPTNAVFHTTRADTQNYITKCYCKNGSQLAKITTISKKINDVNTTSNTSNDNHNDDEM